jgi:integrase
VSRPSGFVFRLEKTRGASWWAKYRLPDGTQVKRKIGPAWTGRGRPVEGHFTKRLAEDWLHDRLEEVRRSGVVASSAAAPAQTGAARAAVAQRVTFAEAAAEYLRFAEQDRGCKPSTVRGYRNAIKVHLLPVFGEVQLEDITVQEIERWRAGMSSARVRELSNKTKNNLLVLMHAIFRHAFKLYGLSANPVASVDRFRVRSSGDIQVFSPEEVWALVRAAKSEADAAIFLTAAFTGLRRGEVLGLRWRDVDFTGSTIRVRASYAAGHLTTPKSGKVRAVPMAPDVASALAKLGDRERYTGDDDFVFAGEAGLPLDGDALSSRYRDALARAGLTGFEVPRSETYVWNADDRQGGHPPCAGVDGPRRHPDDDEVPALRAAGRGRRAGCRGVCGLAGGADAAATRSLAALSVRPDQGWAVIASGSPQPSTPTHAE